MKIAPSLLSANFAHLESQIHALEAGGADQIHIDVMDGQFVSQISFGLPIVKAVRKMTSLPLDVHLMVIQPERHLQAFAEAGANMLTIHVETTPHVHAALQQIHALGCKAGLALNPHTPALMVTDVIRMLEILLVLMVNPGAGGQKLLPEMLPKITRLRRFADEQHRDIDIIVDGGINAETAPLVLQAGANVLVAGTSIFNDPNGIEAGIQTLKLAAEVAV